MPRKRALTDTSALLSVINELVSSERTYVKRLQMLKNDYADPLRSFARSKETAIIPAYEAKTLFGNIDNLLPVNEAFLSDLEKMQASNGSRTVGGVGDVALRHFKELRGFEQYKQYYVKREDAQLIFEREASKRSSRFAAYIDVCLSSWLIVITDLFAVSAYQISSYGSQESCWPARTSHGARAANTKIHSSLSDDVETYGPRGSTTSKNYRGR
jgi:hypothetical protein